VHGRIVRIGRSIIWTTAAACAAAVVCAYAAAAPQARAGVDRDTLLRDLELLSADNMQGREVGTAGGAKACAYVTARFKASGVQSFGESYLVPFTFTPEGGGGSVQARQGVNIVGRIDGRASDGRYLVISAHYDHLGVKNGQIYNGADDNASGTAALIALGGYFAKHSPEHSLILAAFDAEEEGLRGSQAFVAHPPVDRSAIVMNVNLDMIGRDPARRLFAVGTFLNPFLKPYIARVAAASPITLLMGHDNPAQKDVEDWTRDSDHWTFQAAGIPAIYLGDEDFDQHHKATDDYATMTLDFFVEATDTALALVQELDGHLDEIAQSRHR
jgi:Zn-dependent M28 family amino/carboxypeptidase